MTHLEQLQQIASEQQALANRLARIIEEATSSTAPVEALDWPVFDPDVDEPPLTPSIDGDRNQQDWVSIVLWSRLVAINVRQHRAARREEYVQIAKDAGYKDGRGWNKWYGWTEKPEGRWATAAAYAHLKEYYRRQRRTIPADIRTWFENGAAPE